MIEIIHTVMIESPFEGGTDREVDNVEYAKRCMNDALRRGEAPCLSHLLYPKTLDDTIPEQRERRIKSGHAIAARLEAWIFYLDRGMTRGMLEGVDAAVAAGFRPFHRVAASPGFGPYERPILFRTFDPEIGDRTCYASGQHAESGQLYLHECARWPLLLAHFEKHALREWDLP